MAKYGGKLRCRVPLVWEKAACDDIVRRNYFVFYANRQICFGDVMHNYFIFYPADQISSVLKMCSLNGRFY